MPGRTNGAVALAVAVCLGWAGVEARHLAGGAPRPDACALRAADPGAVEKSFAAVLAARDAGNTEQALLELRERAARGPYPGYASYLLGELAYAEGAYPAAVGQFRTAVEREPGVGDRRAAFRAGAKILQRLEDLRRGPWAGRGPAEIPDLYYLQRRLAGGCE